MSRPAMVARTGRGELLTAVWRTWGARGIARRSAYELARRSGALRARERRWSQKTGGPSSPLGPAGITTAAGATAPPPIERGSAESGPAEGKTGRGRFDGRIRLYGGLDVDLGEPPQWHRHPLAGHRYPSDVHWSELSDSGSQGGDIKDLWEPSRLGWLQPLVRSWAVTGDEAIAERVWSLIEDWHRHNPAFAGPNWMCGQETSLRTISVIFAADALATSSSTTPARRLLIAAMVQDAVGRVAPTLGYALSQRNNHASSEAGFLWTASVLAPWLPGADRLRRRSSRALTEVVADQFDVDGSYAQHSPTYHRVALHVLLWCLSVARANDVEPPAGVVGAIDRSIDHLAALMVPDSGGRMPNLGGNDGALVFDLGPADIGDFRPVLVHAAAATGRATGLGPGSWDEEASWFGLEANAKPLESTTRAVPEAELAQEEPEPAASLRRGVDTHVLTVGSAHGVLRAGVSPHRPAHADQLHVDLWLAGQPVAVDPGVYRYSAPTPWDNALADEIVHNVARRPDVAQAVRSGRFFWRRWSTATVDQMAQLDDAAYALVHLVLIDGTVLRRLLAVADGRVVVVDWVTEAGIELRWNLPADADVRPGSTSTTITGDGWHGRLAHQGPVSVPTSDDDDPVSGWQALSYGVRQPVTALLVGPEPVGTVVSSFARTERVVDLTDLVVAARTLTPDRIDPTSIGRLFSAS